eukprot:1510282-Amphidinium_carterae.1
MRKRTSHYDYGEEEILYQLTDPFQLAHLSIGSTHRRLSDRSMAAGWKLRERYQGQQTQQLSQLNK